MYFVFPREDKAMMRIGMLPYQPERRFRSTGGGATTTYDGDTAEVRIRLTGDEIATAEFQLLTLRQVCTPAHEFMLSTSGPTGDEGYGNPLAILQGLGYSPDKPFVCATLHGYRGGETRVFFSANEQLPGTILETVNSRGAPVFVPQVVLAVLCCCVCVLCCAADNMCKC
jgi:hypothetical protein